MSELDEEVDRIIQERRKRKEEQSSDSQHKMP